MAIKNIRRSRGTEHPIEKVVLGEEFATDQYACRMALLVARYSDEVYVAKNMGDNTYLIVSQGQGESTELVDAKFFVGREKSLCYVLRDNSYAR